MKNKNLTIMFTDMKEFTSRTSAQSRLATIDMIRLQKELLLPVALDYGGTLIKTIGDALLITFESPTDAVLSGMKMQSTIKSHNEKHQKTNNLKFASQSTPGEVSLDDGDVYGEAVNIAARVEGIAEANEVYFTEATYLSMNKSEVPSSEIGYRHLKGIPSEIKIYKVLRENIPGSSTETKIPYPPHSKAQNPKNVPNVTSSPTGEPNKVSSIPSPHWRRLLAFSFDAILIFLITAILLSDAIDKKINSDAKLAIETEKLAQSILSDPRKMAECIPFLLESGHIKKPPPKIEQAIKTIKDNKAGPLMQRNQYRKLHAAIRNHPESEDKLTKALSELAWSDYPIPENLSSHSTFSSFRKKRDKGLHLDAQTNDAFAPLWTILFLLYSTIALTFWNKTLGKKLFRLSIQTSDKNDLSFSKSALRSILYLLSTAISGLGFVWILFDSKKQGWHDKIADTQVVFLPKTGS